MRRLAARLSATGPDDGLGLVEVIVALFVFAIVTAGVVASMSTVLSIARDNRGREVATNLAAQTVDAARSVSDVFTLDDRDYTQTIDGVAYSIHEDVNFETTNGVDATCATAGGALTFLRVNVLVTWPGMRATNPVRADTIVAPNSKINDPSFGTIITSVQSAATGTGVGGVDVTIVPATAADGVSANTAQPLSTQPGDTNSQGCSFAIKATPGTYKVTVAKTTAQYRSIKQEPAPSQLVTLSAGSSASATFSYDIGTDYRIHYASNYTVGPVLLPSALQTTFVSTNPQYVAPTPDADRYLSPLSSGYQAMAGAYAATGTKTPSGADASCRSVDPAEWAAGPGYAAGSLLPAVGGVSGGIADLNVPMGVVTVSTLGGVVRATSTTGGAAGDPGCVSGMTYYIAVPAGTATIALPFGTWSLWNGVSQSLTLVPVLGPSVKTTGTSSPLSNIVTLDPRAKS